MVRQTRLLSRSQRAESSPHPAAPRKSADRYDAEDEFVSYSVQVLVVDIETGQVTDSGGGHDYPDLASVGPVVTDYRGS
jgi:hypothetical protein